MPAGRIFRIRITTIPYTKYVTAMEYQMGSMFMTRVMIALPIIGPPKDPTPPTIAIPIGRKDFGTAKIVKSVCDVKIP